MSGFTELPRRAARRLRPAATRVVASVTAPTLATKDDLEVGLHQVRRDMGDGVAELRDSIAELRNSVAELRRLIVDDLDANAEVATLLGRAVAEVRTRVEALAERE